MNAVCLLFTEMKVDLWSVQFTKRDETRIFFPLIFEHLENQTMQCADSQSTRKLK